MSTRELTSPEEFLVEPESVLEKQDYEFTDEEIAEIERYAVVARAELAAGRCKLASEVFAEAERKYTLGS